MSNSIPFYQAIHELKRVKQVMKSHGPKVGESKEHLHDDLEQVEQMIQLLEDLRPIYSGPQR